MELLGFSHIGSFAVAPYQRRKFRQQNPGIKLRWAFLIYGLDVPTNKAVRNFANHVTDRDVWFLPWKWIGQFPISYPPTGPYIYVPTKRLPAKESCTEINVNGGKLYVPRNDTQLIETIEEKLSVPF